jgi:uncharacterized protein with GYD domain
MGLPGKRRRPAVQAGEVTAMKILWQVRYTTEGSHGLLEEGGSKRKETIAHLLEGMGGKLESFYFAFGDDDAFVIADVPDATTAAAISLKVNAAGGAALKTVPLLTAKEFDDACKRKIDYRAPGKR